MKAKTKIFTMAMMGAMLSSMAQTSEREYYQNENESNKEPKEPIIPKGHVHYWFRIDGTFLNEKQNERMLKEECVFKCFALNDKNAIKKFKKFLTHSNS